MNKREFNKHLNSCKRGKRLDIDKIKALPEEVKTGMAYVIIRYRAPVLQEMITDQIDQSWLACMGYMYKSKGAKSGYTFIHTCEHRII